MAKIQYNKLSRHVLEAVKTLKSNIMFSSVDKPIRSLVLTSCEVGAGKTTTAALLGINMAESGKRTLLVETDLRRPNLGGALGLRSEIGLCNVLLSEKTIEEVTRQTEYEGLYFIDCGPVPPNPVEMIGSQQFKHFMELVKQQYDIVIYDMAPVGLFIEPALVAAEVDGVVLVISQGEVDYRAAQEAKEQLDRAHAKILGVVLNKVQHQSGNSYYYDRDYYYYDYYDQQTGEKKHKKKDKSKSKDKGKAKLPIR